MTNTKWFRAISRGIRTLIAILLAGIGVYYGKSEWYILLAPVIMSIDKYIRDWLDEEV